jgi:hypothetical protein
MSDLSPGCVKTLSLKEICLNFFDAKIDCTSNRC